MTRLSLLRSLAVAILVLGLTSPLSAHPRLLKASPEVGERLSVFPLEIRLTFSLAVNPDLSRIELVGPEGVVPLGGLIAHSDSASVLIAGIAGPLGDGAFTVRWTAVGDDGHPVEGDYPFNIITGVVDASITGEDGGPTESPPPDQDSAPEPPARPTQSLEISGSNLKADSPVYVLVRWVNFMGIIGAIGAVAFSLLVLPLVVFRTGRQVEVSTKRLAARVGFGSAVLTLAGAGARLLAQRAALFGTGAAINLAEGTGALMSTAWGAGWILQVVAGSTALVGFRLAGGRPRLGWGLALLGSLLLSPTPALSGHAVSAESFGALPVLADTLHVIGAGGWIGSLFVLLLSAGWRGKERVREESHLADLVQAFSPTALFFVGVLVGSGVFGVWTQLGSISALWSTEYGRVFMLKMGILTPVFVIGAYNALRMKPALAEGVGTGNFRWSAGLEVSIASLVLLVTSLLVATPTPLHGDPQISPVDEVGVVVRAFHRALSEGDSARVTQLLAADVRVLESGGLENREEYLSHHLPGDMAFAAAVERVQESVEIVVEGGVAWAISSSRTTGTFRDRRIDSEGAELVVLMREGGEWRIRAIHWSSRRSS